MNIQYEFWKLIAEIKESDFMRDLRIFYREEPWACTFIFSGALFFGCGMSYLIGAVIYMTWPNSLYIFLAIMALITTTRAILNWISRS